MKLVYLTPLLLMFVVPQAFAENSLENEHLFAESATVTLDIQFGDDIIKQTAIRTISTSTLDNVKLTFYGDEITISDPELKVTSNGNHFRISSLPDGIIMYGHKNMDLDNYKINVYFPVNGGFTKFPVTTAAELQDDKVIETQPKEEKEQYVPELIITTGHDFKTYWKDTFNIEVMAYDERNNSRPDLYPFEGTVDGVNVIVILSIDNNKVATLSGTTEYGEWKGSHYFVENLSTPGEYVVDVIASYLGKTVSETSTMFVIGVVPDSGGSSKPPVDTDGDGIPDASDACPTMAEDFDGDMDLDGCPE